METALATKHRCLIDNLTKLFNLFVTLRYIAATDVIYPPHIDPPINTADMARLGFDPEVITLVTLLPQLRHEVVWGWQEEGTALLPRSMAVNYLSPALDVLFDRLRDGSSNDLLPPTVLRLTRGGNVGHSLLYDTADQSITIWGGDQIWHRDEAPRRPCSVAMEEIIGKVTGLEWVPLYNPADAHEVPVRELVDTPAFMANEWATGVRAWTGGRVTVPLDDDAAFLAISREFLGSESSMDNLRWQINRWRSLQKLYRDAGWNSDYPDSNRFDGDAFERTRANWLQRLKFSEDEYYDSEQVTWQGRPLREEDQLRLDEAKERLEAFWAESAGDRYV